MNFSSCSYHWFNCTDCSYLLAPCSYCGGGCVLNNNNTFGIPLHVLKEIETVLKVTLSVHEIWWALKKSPELSRSPAWNNWPEKVVTYGRNYFLCDIWTELTLDWHCFFWSQAELHDLPSLLLTVFQVSAAPMCPFVNTDTVSSTWNQKSPLWWYLPWWDWYSVSLLHVVFAYIKSGESRGCTWWLAFRGQSTGSWYELCDLN